MENEYYVPPTVENTCTCCGDTFNEEAGALYCEECVCPATPCNHA